jgi:hypothetical protein
MFENWNLRTPIVHFELEKLPILKIIKMRTVLLSVLHKSIPQTMVGMYDVDYETIQRL